MTSCDVPTSSLRLYDMEPAYLKSSSASKEALESMAFKKRVLKAKKLFEAAAQVPSPQKDWAQIVVTEGGVVWRRWRITLRGVAQGTTPTPSPSEVAMSHEDFKYDTTLQGEIERTFGADTMRQIRRIVSGSTDELSRLPEDVMVRIATHLDLQSIAHLSQVNCHLREVCGSNALWKQLYRIHQGVPNEEVKALAEEMGWRSVFYMNKLQLQKELSRRRRLHSPSHHRGQAHNEGTATPPHQSPSTTFLTQSF